MNYATNVKSRKIAVVLAALFMLCTSFAVLADSSDAGPAEQSVIPTDEWLSSKNILEFSDCPSDFDLTLDSGIVTSVSDKTILIKDGASLSVPVGSRVTFENCTIYFEGAAHIDYDEMIVFDNTSLWVGGVLIQLPHVFSSVRLPLGDLAVSQETNGDSTLVSFSSSDTTFIAYCNGATEYYMGAYASAKNIGEMTLKFTLEANRAANDVKVTIPRFIYDGISLVDLVIDCKDRVVTTSYVPKIISNYGKVEITPTEMNEVKLIAESDPNFELTMEDSYGCAVTFSNAALKGLSAGTLEVAMADPTDDQKKLVGDDATIVNITFGTNTQFDGKVTVSIPYSAIDGKDMSRIYVGYLDGDKIVPMPTTYENGVVTFTTNHFSSYAIMFGESPSAPASGNIPFYAAFAVCIVLLVVAVVLGYRKN